MKNFLFDLYGTLLDIRTDEESEGFWARIATRLGCGAEEARTAYRELCASADPEREIDLDAVFSELLGRFRSPLSSAEFAAIFRRESVIRCLPFEGARDLLSALRGRARLYLCSNAQACFTNAEIDGAGLRPFFEGILLSSEIGFKKPSAAFFEEAFARFGLSPETCVYVGNDLRDDVEGARRVGMRSVYIQTEQSGKYEGIAADMVASDYASLRELLCSLAD